jgi:hypothetical protein
MSALEAWTYLCVFLCYFVPCRQRSCDGLIPHPRSHTNLFGSTTLKLYSDSRGQKSHNNCLTYCTAWKVRNLWKFSSLRAIWNPKIIVQSFQVMRPCGSERTCPFCTHVQLAFQLKVTELCYQIRRRLCSSYTTCLWLHYAIDYGVGYRNIQQKHSLRLWHCWNNSS